MIEVRPGETVRTRVWLRWGAVLKAYRVLTPCCGREVRLDARWGRPEPAERPCVACGVIWEVEVEPGCRTALWSPKAAEG